MSTTHYTRDPFLVGLLNVNCGSDKIGDWTLHIVLLHCAEVRMWARVDARGKGGLPTAYEIRDTEVMTA